MVTTALGDKKMLRSRLKLVIAEYELRTGKKVKQHELASKVGISAQYLSKIATDKAKSPDPEILWKLARELECEVGELFMLEDDK